MQMESQEMLTQTLSMFDGMFGFQKVFKLVSEMFRIAEQNA
jgi:hypothetical protein